MPQDLTTEDLDIAQYERLLLIDKHRLDEELVDQPKVFNEVAAKAAWAAAERDEAKDRIRQVEGELNARVRMEAEERNEKVTETSIIAKVNAHPERSAVVKNHIQKAYEADKWQALKDSFSSRAFMIRDLCNLWTAGYFQTNSINGGARKADEARDSSNRQALNAARQAANGRVRLSDG